MSYAESREVIKAVAPEPVAQPAKAKKTRRYGITPWEWRRIDKEQVRLLKDALELK
jgi:hypothetical protein